MGKALIKMGGADRSDAVSANTAKDLMLAAESFQKPIRVPLLSALPPYQTLKGNMIISMFVTCIESEWDQSWDDLVDRSITVGNHGVHKDGETDASKPSAQTHTTPHATRCCRSRSS